MMVAKWRINVCGLREGGVVKVSGCRVVERSSLCVMVRGCVGEVGVWA